MKINIVLLVLIAINMSCRKPYNPPVINAPNSYLVVDGVINAAGKTTIKLSRTVNLSGANTVNPVTGAVISIESSANNAYLLAEGVKGVYTSDSLTLSGNLKYCLAIKTTDNKQYASDFEAVTGTPAIDSIGFIITSGGIQLYANTHDPANNTRYYRWDYNETWKFHALYYSGYITTDQGPTPRTPQQDIYSCFKSDTSSNIVLGSSARLSQDVIYQQPITAIPSTSEKIETEYSIQVNQYALSSDAYNFWTNLKKNTEQLGSIFDAQPSNINGNIHNTADATEPVVGYVSVSTIQTKRVFIFANQLPHWVPIYPYECLVDSDYFIDPKSGVNEVQLYLTGINTQQIPIGEFYIMGVPSGYTATVQQCVDCTIRGTKTQPAFWK